MANFFIVSNNPLAAEKYAAQTQLLTGSPAEVYRAARDAVHRGSRLISHPLAGSVKPNETPYRSIVLSAAGGVLDFRSLQLIEDAILVLKKLPQRQTEQYTPAMHADYQVIDLDLLDSAIAALPAEFHF